ncbi:hypothetical protein B484DRAFT_414861 [Ochromonadaceae sp. CCMP2298]|nr:hypothetical protein B484DRAFT_414861 [Ochromonadaceae sp. CCMP2298]
MSCVHDPATLRPCDPATETDGTTAETKIKGRPPTAAAPSAIRWATARTAPSPLSSTHSHGTLA